jgi:gliding motility-associated-like protein
MRLSFLHIIWFLYSVFVFNNSVYGQCDVAISSWDAATGDIVIEAINSENCGCNEFTTDGNTCETSGSPYVANNETIGHIVLGLHVEGLDYNWGCTTANNHPGWAFKAFTLFGNQVLESGDSWVANVYDSPSSNDCWAEILANDTLCTELVVWQINLSRTASAAEGGWAVNGGGALQTQNYPDIDLSNNTAVNCALPACDTVYVDVEVIEYITDTITLVEIDTVILYDTTYITLPPDTVILTQVDTLIEYIQLPPDTIYEYLTDTITLIETEYIDVIIDNYVYVTDTITEFVSITTYIDCETGEQCGELSPCNETSIYAPNVVTPNDDGWNDTWQIIADGACWGQWEVRVYNRWGGLVWISASSNDAWEADVATGVYVYTITAHSSVNTNVFEFNGTITVMY